MDASSMIVMCARLVLEHQDNRRLLDALARQFPSIEDLDLAMDYTKALGFIEAQLGRAAVEKVLAKHKALVPV